MITRKIVSIDEALCNGCGACIPRCAEGALQLVNGKAKIIAEKYCDGLGACLGHCPQGAITVVEREANDFDEKAVHDHLAQIRPTAAVKPIAAVQPQWPVQLNLVPVEASFYQDADLLITADCAPVACSTLHEKLMRGRRIVIGCPKFDNVQAYAEKLGEILKHNNIASVTVAHMVVPCCSGLKWMVDKAVQASGKQIPVKRYIIEIGGEINEQ
jgi:NAD-dependent dihydropyrimidine dehydrogenase PreA subunit